MPQTEQQQVICPVCHGQCGEGEPCFTCHDDGKVKLSDWLEYAIGMAARNLAIKGIDVARKMTDAAAVNGEVEKTWAQLAEAEGMGVENYTRYRIDQQTDDTAVELKTLQNTAIMGLLSYVVSDQYHSLQRQLDPTYQEPVQAAPVAPQAARRRSSKAQSPVPPIDPNVLQPPF